MREPPALNAILEATRARPAGRGRWTGHCPAHKDRTPSLSIALGQDGRVLLHCFSGCPPEAVLDALGLEWKDLFPDGEFDPSRVRPVRWEAPPPTPDEGRRRALERLWAEAVPLDSPRGEVGRRYLEARGLDLGKVLPELQNLRLHPALKYRDGEEVLGPFPALLARVEHPRFGLVALHRTYLAPDGRGKAPVPSPKKLTRPVFEGATRGAAVRLYPLGERKELALAEGIETALAVREATGLPTWACVSAVGMERVELPKEVKRVLIAADGDTPGLRAARTLAKRLLGKGRVRVSLAESPGGRDWLDMLLSGKGVGVHV
ncbi:DUF7146 domain-containing protein [Thermus caliditerrae]|uniref:DUF7146 domain-containing protein n=1 Tax=Thermus caliditerrae TaxID=1330700 RepID=UPI001F21592D|nr:toprim domain-containing protein [Thermus caliditerrae]